MESSRANGKSKKSVSHIRGFMQGDGLGIVTPDRRHRGKHPLWPLSHLLTLSHCLLKHHPRRFLWVSWSAGLSAPDAALAAKKDTYDSTRTREIRCPPLAPAPRFPCSLEPLAPFQNPGTFTVC